MPEPAPYADCMEVRPLPPLDGGFLQAKVPEAVDPSIPLLVRQLWVRRRRLMASDRLPSTPGLVCMCTPGPDSGRFAGTIGLTGPSQPAAAPTTAVSKMLCRDSGRRQRAGAA